MFELILAMFLSSLIGCYGTIKYWLFFIILMNVRIKYILILFLKILQVLKRNAFSNCGYKQVLKKKSFYMIINQ